QIGTYYTRLLLIQVDNDGNVIWARTYKKDFTHLYPTAIKTTDDGFIVTGVCNLNEDTLKTFSMRFNNVGHLLWSKTYNHPSDYIDRPNIIQTSDSGFLITGELKPEGYGALIKTTSFGENCSATNLAVDTTVNYINIIDAPFSVDSVFTPGVSEVTVTNSNLV